MRVKPRYNSGDAIAQEGVKQSPPPVAPCRHNCRHSGIFIPPAQDSGIAHWRWRNENVRNLWRQRVGTPMGWAARPSHRIPRPLSLGDSGYFHPARPHPSRTFNIAPARDENSGMTTRGTPSAVRESLRFLFQELANGSQLGGDEGKCAVPHHMQVTWVHPHRIAPFLQSFLDVFVVLVGICHLLVSLPFGCLVG